MRLMVLASRAALLTIESVLSDEFLLATGRPFGKKTALSCFGKVATPPDDLVALGSCARLRSVEGDEEGEP